VVYYVLGVSPSSTFTISGGVYPGAPSYTIWREGDYYFAKDANGEIDFSGTNSTYVIQNAINNGYGRIFFKKGTYMITSTVEITHGNVFLDGEIELSDMSEEQSWNQGGGVKWLGDGTTKLLYIHGSSRTGVLECIHISNICFDGGATSQTVGAHLIHARYVAEFWVTDCGLRRSADDGIYIEEGNEIFWILNNDISLNYGSGVDVYVSTNGTNMIHQLHIEGNHLWNNHLYGIKLKSENTAIGDFLINDNSVRENYRNGIHLEKVLNGEVIGNQIDGNDYLDTQTYNGISIEDSKNVRVAFNRCYDNDKYEIYVNNLRQCQIIHNDLNGTDHVGALGWNTGIGTQNTIKFNTIFVTENSGTATISASTTVTFNHGLSGIPTHVECGFKTGVYGSWLWAATSTQITISVTTSGTYTFSWYAEYKP
jgi:hypothetical protein